MVVKYMFLGALMLSMSLSMAQADKFKVDSADSNDLEDKIWSLTQRIERDRDSKKTPNRIERRSILNVLKIALRTGSRNEIAELRVLYKRQIGLYKKQIGLGDLSILPDALIYRIGSHLDLKAGRYFFNTSSILRDMLIKAPQKSRAVIRKIFDSYLETCRQARRANEKLAKEGSKDARERLFLEIRYGKNGYVEDPEKAALLNIQWAHERDREARERLFLGIRYGKNGYLEEPKKAARLNIQWAKEGDKEARERLFLGLLCGENGYLKDRRQARKINNQWAEKGDREAQWRIAWGLRCGADGYPKKPEEARKLKDAWGL